MLMKMYLPSYGVEVHRNVLYKDRVQQFMVQHSNVL